MAKTIITLDKAIRKGIIKDGDLVNPYNLYSSTTEKVILCDNETGTHDVKVYKREEKLKCFYAENSSGIPTLWFTTTKYCLPLKGMEGILNAGWITERICKLYSNINLGMIARATKENDIKFMSEKDETKKRLSEFKGCFWLGDSSYVLNYNNGKTYSGVLKANGYNIGNCDLYDSDGISFSSNAGIRPAVSFYLPSKILVDVESKEEYGEWRLLPNK